MIGFYRRYKERKEAQRKQDEYDRALADLHRPDVFSKDQRTVLKELFPNAWTHMDNFSQEEIFKIAVTLTVFGFTCDTPEKMKGAINLLHIQRICIAYPGSPDVIKRA